MRVLGIKSGSFNDRETGNNIKYCQIHVASEDKNVVGEAVDILKLSADLHEIGKALKPGDKIQVAYNKFGKVEIIQKLS